MLSLSLFVGGGRTGFGSILGLEFGIFLVRLGPEGVERGLLRFEIEEEGIHGRERKGEGGGSRSARNDLSFSSSFARSIRPESDFFDESGGKRTNV